MHKTHIFDQKELCKKNFFTDPTYPIYFRTVTGNKQFIFLGIIGHLGYINDIYESEKKIKLILREGEGGGGEGRGGEY